MCKLAAELLIMLVIGMTVINSKCRWYQNTCSQQTSAQCHISDISVGIIVYYNLLNAWLGATVRFCYIHVDSLYSLRPQLEKEEFCIH